MNMFHAIKRAIKINGKVVLRAGDLDSVCLHCRQPYGEHFGRECPNPITLEKDFY